MGGKGGGGGGGGGGFGSPEANKQYWLSQATPEYQDQLRKSITDMAADPAQKDAYDQTYGPGGVWRPMYETLFPAKAEETPAPADTPKPAEPAPVTPDPTPEPTPDPTPTPAPIDPGGAVDQPSGDVLGGSILNPPKYWVGGIDSYKKGPSTKSSSLTTTQT
jgi:hypothetical protein